MKRLTYSNSMQKRRHRHKLILPLWCILLLVTGCGNLYTGDESLYDPNHQDNQGDQTQLPVMVAFSDPIYNVLTRGAGVLDPTDETNFSKRIADGTFFVYAFRRDNPNGMTYAHRRAEDADRRYCLIDGSLDDSPQSNANCTANGRLMQETARSLTGKVPDTSPITICRKNSTPSTSLLITTTMRKWAK